MATKYINMEFEKEEKEEKEEKFVEEHISAQRSH